MKKHSNIISYNLVVDGYIDKEDVIIDILKKTYWGVSYPNKLPDKPKECEKYSYDLKINLLFDKKKIEITNKELLPIDPEMCEEG